MLFCKKRKEFLQMPMKSGLKEFRNFSKILKLTTVGITPAEYINLQKISYAKKMLSNGKSNITDLAYTLGFSSSNYFSSVF